MAPTTPPTGTAAIPRRGFLQQALCTAATLAPPGLAWAANGVAVMRVVGEDTKTLLKSDGSVWTWGWVPPALLTNVADGKPARPTRALVPVALPRPAIDLASNGDQAMAVLDDGTVFGWPLPPNTARAAASAPPLAAQPLFGLSGVVQIVANGSATLVRRQDGSVLAWGSRGSGLIGDGLHPKRYLEDGPHADTPVLVPGLANVRHLALGSGHALALDADGVMWSWGSNYCGALGRPPRRELPMDRAEPIPNLGNVLTMAGGAGMCTALKKDGSVWVWGANWHGQFGNGDRTDPPGVDYGWQLEPQRVPGVSDVVALSLGLTGRHTLVLLRDGSLRGWGNSDWGQLGAGVAGDFQTKPVKPAITGVRAVFAVGNNSFAVRQDNSLWAWGAGGRGEWPLAVQSAKPVPITLP